VLAVGNDEHPDKGKWEMLRSRDEGWVVELHKLNMSLDFTIPETWLRISVSVAEISVSGAEFPDLKKGPAHSCFPYCRLSAVVCRSIFSFPRLPSLTLRRRTQDYSSKIPERQQLPLATPNTRVGPLNLLARSYILYSHVTTSPF
jgi:hypothetical protein